jgi:hypothetical protein
MEVHHDIILGTVRCLRYYFSDGRRTVFGRRFSDTMDRAEIRHSRDSKDRLRYFRTMPYTDALFRAAARYFFHTLGVKEVTVMLMPGRLATATFQALGPEDVAD